MQYIGKALKFLFSIYAFAIIILTLLIAFTFYALILGLGGKNADQKAHKYVSRNWAQVLLILLFIRLKIKGKEKLSSNQNYIFVSNHRSMLDIPVCALLTNHFFKFLAKEELTRIPLLGWVIAKLYITVSRGSTRDRVKSMGKMREEVLKGTGIWIYPEGTRNKTELAVKEFEDGAFWLAIETQTPLAVVSIVDTGKLLASGELFSLRPGVLHAYWEKPVSVEGLTKKDLPELKQKVHELLEKRILELRKN